MTFVLDRRLAADTYPVTELALSSVLLMNDRRFPWLVLVPRRTDSNGAPLRELIDLSDEDAATLLAEIRRVSRALSSTFSAHKLNVAALGNQVAQLHVHVIARSTDDPAWPRPVWGFGAPQLYSRETLERRVATLVAAITASR